MKTILGLGLAILSFVLVVALRRTDASPPPVPEGKAASADPQQISKAAHIREVAFAGSE